MNTYPKSLIAFQSYKDSYLLSLEPTLFNYFDKILDNCLFFTLTNYASRNYEELDQYDFDSYKYIFLLDSIDPPHYHDTLGKWEDMKLRFAAYLDKTFVVSSLYENPYFKTIHFDTFLHFVPEHFKEIEFSRNFTKKYLSYNGQPHSHRLDLLKTLHQKNLLNDGYVTGYIKDKALSLDDGISKEDYLDFNNQITTNKYYYSTPVNLVTETSISHNCMFISEKTVKAIISKQLIMLVGNPYSYQYLTNVYGLKNYGFDFEPKLDSLGNYQDKINYYCDFLKETTLNDLISIYREKEDILEYNKNKVLKEFKQISYNLFLTSLKKHRIIRT